MTKSPPVDKLRIDATEIDDVVVMSAHGPLVTEEAGEEGVKVFARDGRQLAALQGATADW